VDWYTDDATPSTTGRLFFVPLALSYQAEEWGISVSGGYAASAFRPGEGPDGDLDHFIDTTVSARWTPVLLGGRAILGADVDLPTGKTKLSPTEQLATQDRDLVLISNFGTGLNANLHADWARPIGPVTVGVGAGFQLRREYDPTGDIPDDNVDPGSQLTATARIEGLVGTTLNLGLQLTHLRFGTDERGGQQIFEVGSVWEVAASIDYRPEPWWGRITARWNTTGKHRRLDATGQLAREPHRGSGNAILVSAEAGYVVSEILAVRLMGDVYDVAANDYPADDPFFDAGRTKVALGPGVTWSPLPNVSVDLSVKGFVLWDTKDAIHGRDTRFTGVHADLLVTYRF
jgi:hypothetical protein